MQLKRRLPPSTILCRLWPHVKCARDQLVIGRSIIWPKWICDHTSWVTKVIVLNILLPLWVQLDYISDALVEPDAHPRSGHPVSIDVAHDPQLRKRTMIHSTNGVRAILDLLGNVSSWMELRFLNTTDLPKDASGLLDNRNWTSYYRNIRCRCTHRHRLWSRM